MPSHDIDPRLIGLLILALERQRYKPQWPPRSPADNLVQMHAGPAHVLLDELAADAMRHPPTAAVIEQHLQRMEEMGLIKGIRRRDRDSRFPFRNVRLSSAKEFARYGNGADGGGRGGNGEGADGPERGPGGIREVLSHPILFALPQDEFEGVVGQLFAEPEAR